MGNGRAVMIVVALVGGCGRVSFDELHDARRSDATSSDAPSAARCEQGSPTLIGCYHLEGAGTDASVHHNDAVDTTGVSYEAGHTGLAARFTDNLYLDVADSPSLDPTDAMTLAAWVRLDAAITSGRAMVVDNNGQYAMFVTQAGYPVCSFNQAGPVGTLPPSPIAMATWVHLACVFTGTFQLEYVDGVEVLRVPGTAPLNTSGTEGVRLGNDEPIPAAPWLGLLDEVELWNRALTPDEICVAAGC